MGRSVEYQKFSALADSVLSVSREEMQRREAAYRAEVDANPKRRGPKRGTKRKLKQPSASPVPDEQLPS